jgi:hypothetical protein
MSARCQSSLASDAMSDHGRCPVDLGVTSTQHPLKLDFVVTSQVAFVRQGQTDLVLPKIFDVEDTEILHVLDLYELSAW